MKKVFVYKRTGEEVSMTANRDVWMDEELLKARSYCPCETMDSEDPLFILYTSGSTGKPKGVAHTTGGYLVNAAMTTDNTFDLRVRTNNIIMWFVSQRFLVEVFSNTMYDLIIPLSIPPSSQDGDVYACVADCGWITGHTYIVYGPLINGATTVMFESIPTYPNPYRYWDLVQRHKVTQFYTAPTAGNASPLSVRTSYSCSTL